MAYLNPLRRRLKKEFFAAIPTGSGVYFMRGREGRLLYVGKAKNLRARLITYRHANPGTVGENIVAMLERVRTVDWELTPTEEMAARREREIIRAIVPPFNVADAWQEDYLYVALGPVRAARGKSTLGFALTDREDRPPEGFELHGCFPHRRLVKNTFAAMLRLLYAAEAREGRFAFPAKLCGAAPRYEVALNLRDARRWRRQVSAFLHGYDTKLLPALVVALLENTALPEYVRPALQRDIDVLAKFAAVCPPNPTRETRTQQELRRKIRDSVRAA